MASQEAVLLLSHQEKQNLCQQEQGHIQEQCPGAFHVGPGGALWPGGTQLLMDKYSIHPLNT
jgi:hypothetical protein